MGNAQRPFSIENIDIEIQELLIKQQFVNACVNNQLELAQQLFYDHNIDISEFAFRETCIAGHLRIAQWLLSIKPNIDISAYHDITFRITCNNKHLHVAQWLQTLKPYSYIINYNQDGTYKSYQVRTKQQEIWERRKYPLWLASDTTPNKNNILYRLPQDLSRIIISYI